MSDDDRLLDANEAASLLNVPVSWIREHSRTGELPSVPLGRYRRYVRADLLAYVDAKKNGGGARFRRYQPRLDTEAA